MAKSVGKKQLKIYISGVLQSDAVVDSINVSKSLDSSHTASFILGRAYDDTKPTLESVVEIKLKNWLMYKGYITSIIPGDKPDQIRIQCNDEFWKTNKEHIYFNVGYKPTTGKVKYYETINSGLSALGVNWNIGKFIPQQKSLYGMNKASAITSLVNESGNFSWFYDNGTPILWEAGKGNTIKVKAQPLGVNLNLFHVLEHRFTNSAEDIVNRLKVQMGDEVIKTLKDEETEGEDPSSTFFSYYTILTGKAVPAWQSIHEKLSSQNSEGFGPDYYVSSQADVYGNVFKVYNVPILSSKLEHYSDKYPPKVTLYNSFAGSTWSVVGAENFIQSGRDRLRNDSVNPNSTRRRGTLNSTRGTLTSGFTIDYDNGTITLPEAIYLKHNITGVCKSFHMMFTLWKKVYWSGTTSTDEEGSESFKYSYNEDIAIGTGSTFTLDEDSSRITAVSRVTLNGTPLNPGDYSYSGGAVTIGVPLTQQDRIGVGYNYNPSLNYTNSVGRTFLGGSVHEDYDEEVIDDEDDEDIINPLQFNTSKVGSYTNTYWGYINMSGLSKQIGGTYTDSEGTTVLVPSWDDTDFAEDLAYWQLSKTAYAKEEGTIKLTLDAYCQYGVRLDKRIKVKGASDNYLNVTEITLNGGNFTATINLQENHFYQRKVSLQSRR